MNIKPLYDYVVLQLADQTETTNGGLVIPAFADNANNQAVVIAVGTGYVKEDGTVTPLLVAVGDTVLVRPDAGTEVKVDGQEYLIVRENNIMAILA
jgi:chaperonin GroES